MANQPDERPEAGRAASSAGTELARVLAILGVNFILVLVVIVFASTDRGKLPDLNYQTLAVGLLPISAAAVLRIPIPGRGPASAILAVSSPPVPRPCVPACLRAALIVAKSALRTRNSCSRLGL